MLTPQHPKPDMPAFPHYPYFSGNKLFCLIEPNQIWVQSCFFLTTSTYIEDKLSAIQFTGIAAETQSRIYFDNQHFLIRPSPN